MQELTAKPQAAGYAGKLAGFDLNGLRRLLRCVRIGLAMRPDTRRRTGERHGGAGSIEQLTRKLAAIWAELARRGEMERIMEDERQDDVEAGAEPEYCQVHGCIDMARRDGLCAKHLIKLARGDAEAAEAARQFHAVHDQQVVPPRDAHWRMCPEKEKAEKKASDFRRQASGTAEAAKTATTQPTAPRREAPGLKPEALSLEPSSSKENITMGKSRRIKCDLCGREIGVQAIKRHRAACKGPEPTSFKCPICGKGHKSERALHCHQGHSGHGEGEIVARTPKKRKYTRRAAAGAGDILVIGNSRSAILHAGRQVRHQEPPDGIAAVGHAATRLIQIIGLGEQMADFPHPGGHCFVNTQTGQAAIVTTAGEIRAAEVCVK